MPDESTISRRRLIPALCGLCLFMLIASAGNRPTQAAPILTPTQWLYLPFVARDHDPAWQWQTPSPTLSPAPPVAMNTLPVSVIDRQGQVHLFWGLNSTASEGKYIYQSTLTASGWITPTIVRPTLGTSYNPSTPAVGPDGALHLFWVNKLTSTAAPRLLYSAYRNSAWTPEATVFDYPTYGIYDVHPRAAAQIANNGQVYALAQYLILDWYTYQAKQTIYGWQAKAVSDTGIMDLDDWMLGDRDGAVRRFTSRYQNAQYQGYYSYWFDGIYQIKDAPAPFVPHSTSGQLDAANNLHVYWRAEVPIPGGQVMGLFHQCFGPDMAPAGAVELLTGQEATNAWLLPAADESGRWALAWQMATTGEPKIGIWQGCRRQHVTTVPADSLTPWPPYQALFSQTPNRWCGVWKTGTSGYRVRCARIMAP